MFKRNATRPTVVGEEMSDDELSGVVGAQQPPSRERQEFDRQLTDTLEEWGSWLAPFFKPADEAIRLAGKGEALLQRSLDHDVRWSITDHEAAQREEDAREKEEQKQKAAAEERERLLSSNGGNSTVIDSQGGPPGGSSLPDIPSDMINAPVPHDIQIFVEEIVDGSMY